MELSHITYLNIIKNVDLTPPESVTIPPQIKPELVTLASRHATLPFLLPYINDPQYLPLLKQQAKRMLLNYCQIEQFTRRIVSIFEKEQIPYFLLKGISLCDCYSIPEYRKLGDVDLYINDPPALEKAKNLLKQNGFVLQDELSDHHLTYSYTFPAIGRICLLELHFRITGLYQYAPANAVVDEVFSANILKHTCQTVNGISYSVLPPTEYTFYMLHHMLKHYLYSGFGIRLLCDFTFYLKRHAREIDFQRIHDWCTRSRIFHFYEIILQSCRLYLGLPDTIDPEIQYKETDCEQFILKILSDNDMGTVTGNTLVGSGSYRRITPLTYFKEGHLQMHVRFPRIGKCPLLWPALWGITFFCFVRNTYKLRRTTLRDTLHAFHKSNENSQLIRIFDNSDS